MKSQTNYVCQQCGATTTKWFGKCPDCGRWGSLVETIVSAPAGKKSSGSVSLSSDTLSQITSLKAITQNQFTRISSGIAEFDRVLGGGIVPGMAVLLAGEPGIGKSTLLLELAASLARGESRISNSESRNSKKSMQNDDLQVPNPSSVLYVAGEESPQQIKLRADRLGIGDLPIDLFPQTNVDIIVSVIEQQKPSFVIIDSVQTIKTDDLSSTFGSVGQVRESVDRLTMTAKRLHVPIFFIGHVTKEGTIAGPKVLEHIVDTVLVLEGDAAHNFRILRTEKNRFGSTDEVGVFAMDEAGLHEVTNPSQAFLAERQVGAPGSVVVPTLEGTRTILVEIQALTATTTLALPRRVGIGVDYNRLQLLLAILSRRFHSDLAKLDVFVNVAGGLKIMEPALDLGICLSIASAYSGTPLPEDLACFGEIGLLGEVRNVRFAKQRETEAKRLGYKTVIGPDQVRSLSQALHKVFPKK